jgi:hypothetical protein
MWKNIAIMKRWDWEILIFIFHLKELLKLYANLLYRLFASCLVFEIFSLNKTISCPPSWINFYLIGDFSATSYPGSFLLGSKDPGRRWSRDLLKSSRFLINYLGFLYDYHTNYKLNYQNNPNIKCLLTWSWIVN